MSARRSIWSRLFGKRAPLTPGQEERLQAEERLDDKRREMMNEYRRFGKF